MAKDDVGMVWLVQLSLAPVTGRCKRPCLWWLGVVDDWWRVPYRKASGSLGWDTLVYSGRKV